jgi:SAM-dependent methyltransferase
VSLTARLYGAYDWVAERPAVARPLGRLVWGADVSLFYAVHADITLTAAGGALLDVPCGGGPAFRHVPASRPFRYVAVDLDQAMLDRARAEATRRGAENIEFVQAGVEDLPFADGSFDFCLSSAGLHCFPNPAAALAEIGRVLRPGGRLAASMVVRGAGARFDRLMDLYERIGIFGPGGATDDYSRWALAAGFDDIDVTRSGAIARLDAVRRRGTS